MRYGILAGCHKARVQLDCIIERTSLAQTQCRLQHCINIWPHIRAFQLLLQNSRVLGPPCDLVPQLLRLWIAEDLFPDIPRRLLSKKIMNHVGVLPFLSSFSSSPHVICDVVAAVVPPHEYRLAVVEAAAIEHAGKKTYLDVGWRRDVRVMSLTMQLKV